MSLLLFWSYSYLFACFISVGKGVGVGNRMRLDSPGLFVFELQFYSFLLYQSSD
jgi:hypothetical protein